MMTKWAEGVAGDTNLVNSGHDGVYIRVRDQGSANAGNLCQGTRQFVPVKPRMSLRND